MSAFPTVISFRFTITPRGIPYAVHLSDGAAPGKYRKVIEKFIPVCCTVIQHTDKISAAHMRKKHWRNKLRLRGRGIFLYTTRKIKNEEV